MINAIRLLNIGVVLTGAIWLIGCGLVGSLGGKPDRLTKEVDIQSVDIEELRATADTLTKTRSRMLDDLNNLMELNNLSAEEVAILEEQANPDRATPLTKVGRALKKVGQTLKLDAIGRTLKKLWPF